MILLERLQQPNALRVFYQPIVEMGGAMIRPHGIECLTRGPRGTSIEPASILFEYVRQKGAERQVDRLCAARALAALARCRRILHQGMTVNLNVHGVTLAQDSGFVEFLAQETQRLGFSPWQLTIELLEFRSFAGDRTLIGAIDKAHTLGMRVAVDDLGNAESNLRMLLECHADYFKLDQYFVRGIDTDPFRQALLEGLVALSPRFGAWVIAEGVETVDEYLTLRRLGVSLAQGHFFAAPRPLKGAA